MPSATLAAEARPMAPCRCALVHVVREQMRAFSALALTRHADDERSRIT